MAYALEFAADWLRSQNGWKPNECGVQFEGRPCMDAGSFFVGIDDAGVESGVDETDSLVEILTINVGIWRRPEHLMKDQRGIMKLPYDKYLLGAWTIHDMERQVIVPKLKGFHKNYDFLKALNERYNLPDVTNGAKFTTPLAYKGRGRMERIGLDEGGTVSAWFGYTLRFRGLRREQKLRSSGDALG